MKYADSLPQTLNVWDGRLSSVYFLCCWPGTGQGNSTCLSIVLGGTNETMHMRTLLDCNPHNMVCTGGWRKFRNNIQKRNNNNNKKWMRGKTKCRCNCQKQENIKTTVTSKGEVIYPFIHAKTDFHLKKDTFVRGSTVNKIPFIWFITW